MSIKEHLIGSAMRLYFLVIGSVLWLGIWLTGFDTAHWLLYVPAVFFIFAAITGICPGIILMRKILPDKKEPKSEEQ